MKIAYLILFIALSGLLVSDLAERNITDPWQGLRVEKEFQTIAHSNSAEVEIINRDSRVGLNWQTSDPAAIAGLVKVSPTSQNTFVQWHLNNERVSLYHDNAAPLWEHVVSDLDFDYPIDMLEDGSLMAVGDGATLKIFEPASATPSWQLNIGFTIGDLKLCPTGEKVYLSFYDPNLDRGNVVCYIVGQTDPLWNNGFIGGAQTLDISGDGTTLIFTQYGAGNSNMWVLAASDGSIIFQGPEYNQNPPAISYDASIIVNGDYSGFVHVYNYDENAETYYEAWTYGVNGGGTSDWIGGMAISADGSTIAVGTLTFLPAGYNGQIYLFNSYSPNPVWIYENAGDYVIDIDISDDGSLIATASYGPIDNSTADFLLFRRESNIPVFEINTPGSLFTVDLAGDGSFCATGGKAVHARIMGSGGNLYNIDCNLGGGFITGIVNLENSEDNSGVKVQIPELIDYFTFTDYDGNFSLNNVPAGSYTVDYIKVGYLANSNLNVPVIEGETTDLGLIEMMMFGNPPMNLTATQAGDIFVDLNWLNPAGGVVLGYNIYRKQYEQDPFPEIPIGYVDADELSFIDDTALPLIQYFYAVTADMGGGLQSPYSNIEQGWISSGFVVDEISAWAGTTPVIDGTISAGEWDDAFLLDTSDFWGIYDGTVQPIGSVLGYFKTNSEMTELYVAYINYNVPVLGNDDDVALYIDDNNDGVFAPEALANEGNYWIDYFDSGCTIRFRPIYDTGGVGTVMPLNNPQVAASDANGYSVFEFVIPIGTEPWEINPSAENKSSLAIFMRDNDPYDFNGWWPLDNMNLFNPAGFGTITLAGSAQTPPPPTNVSINQSSSNDNILILTWEMPIINDFSHFNIYTAIDNSSFELFDISVGVQYLFNLLELPGTEFQFYLTTLNQLGMESDPSEIVEFITTGSDFPVPQTTTMLLGNYPNPFNPSTSIAFELNSESIGKTEICIYNIKGQKVKELLNDELSAGYYSVVWDGRDDDGKQAASGIYFYRMKSGDYLQSRKMLLMK
jgi:hypothetical protein